MTERAKPPEEGSVRRLEKALSESEPTWTRGEPLAPDEPPRPPARELGDFRILREIGRGGMGVVYEAEQISLKRRVALKVLLPHLCLSEDRVLQFRREAEAEGRQQHPGIVSVYAIGEQAGAHFIAQELIPGGRTLADRLRETREAGEFPRGYFRDVATLFAQVAEALAHAHGNGVIHRDVKPSNILLDPNGAPHVGDFGLARMEDALAQSRSGEFEGTPYYMSPEQVMKRKGGIDHRTDVFSLGVTLYEALTLTRPFDGETSLDVLRRVLQDEPAHPRRLNPRVPGSLATLCLKAMEKEPASRYATMAEFAADLRRWLAGETILARPAGPVTRSFKWVRRHRAITAAGTGALAVALVAGSVLLYRHVAEGRTVRRLMTQAEEAATGGRWNEAVEDLVRALSLRPHDVSLQDRHRLYSQQKELAAVRFERDEKEKALSRSEGLRLASEAGKLLEPNPGLALLVAREAALRYPSLSTRNALADALARCRERRTMYIRRYPFLPEVQGTDRGWIRTVDIRPDGGRLVSCAWDATPSVWDPQTGERIAVLTYPREPGWGRLGARYGVFSPDGRKIGLTDSQQSAWIFDAETGTVIAELRHRGSWPSVAVFSPDGRWVATAGRDSTARIWDAADGTPVHLLGHSSIVGPVQYSPDGRFLATGTADGAAHIWDASTGRELAVLSGHEQFVRSVCYSPDGRILAAVSDDCLRLWESATGRSLHRIPSHRAPVVSVWGIDFTPDGSRVTVTWGDPVGRVWSVATGEEVLQLRGHQGIVRSIHFSPDGTRIVTSAFDNTARIWDAATGAELAVLRGHEDLLHDARYFPDGRRVVTISEDGTMRIWDAEIRPSPEPCASAPVIPLFFEEGVQRAADGRLLEIDRADSVVSVWVRFPDDARRSPLRLRLDRRIDGARFSPDGSLIVTASYDAQETGWLHVWDARTGERLHELDLGRTESSSGASLLHDNRDLLFNDGGGTVRLMELATKQIKFTLRGHQRWVRSASFGADERKLVTAACDGTARVWDTATGQALAVLRGHEGDLMAGCLSPDEKWVVTWALDRTLRLWNAETGEEVWTLRDFDGRQARGIGFHPAGDRVVVVGSDGKTRSWPVDLIAAAERLRPRDLTAAEKKTCAIWDTGEEEALALVERLFAELILSADVIATLEADRALPDPVRAAAIRFARAHEDNAQALLRTADLSLAAKDSPPDAQERARRYREAAQRLIELSNLEVSHQAR